MSWAEAAPAFLVSLLVVFGPGLLWGAALGLRRLTLLALAGPLSITAVVVSAEAAALVGIGWSLLPVAVVAAGVAVLLRFARHLFAHLLHPQPEAAPAASWRTVITAWAVSAVPLAAIMIWIIGVSENIAQSHDNTFHLNALRYIDDTANASSLTLGYLGSREGTFYPAAWHAVVSLVMTSGVPLTAAVNVTNVVLITAIWSTGCLFLVTRVLGEGALPLLVAAVLSTAYSTFPYLLLEFGVVYPFLLSVALLPAALGLVLQLVGAGVPGPLRTLLSVALLIGVLPGLLLAHPSALLGLLALGAPAVLAVVQRRARSADGRARRTALAGGAAFLLVGVLLWATVRPARSGADNWLELGDAGRAVAEVLFHGPLARPVAVLVTVLTVVGAVVVLRRRRNRWILALYAVAAALFVIGNWRQAPDLRWIVTGPWYNDYFRISALLPVGGILLASVGGAAVADALLARARRRRSLRGTPEPSWFVPVLAGALVLSALAVAPFFAVQRGVVEAAAQYRYTDNSRLLTSDELELLQRLPESVPPDAVVAGMPLTGASLSYALADRRTLLPHGTVPATADARLVFEELDTMVGNPEVCAAVRRTNLRFVLDFGSASVRGGNAPVPSGLDELTVENGFVLVDSEGDASLYRIVGCNTPSES
ncbi:hypothetical protein E8P82_00600 [Arthrobacter echini]|uniref:Uncharacterized protein n=1 Tax=Arthrobacter echini TaxID=1529066 RepID=A0A4S5EA34_9MICC|nr:DUF6541 family protein [Arthrobacter echini]THJ68450.1 hypothetical protein E8P82_00600 [Arthrobacter echini]